MSISERGAAVNAAVKRAQAIAAAVSECCETCRYFLDSRFAVGSVVDGNPGFCRRRAPVAGYQFPIVGSGEWCGEYRETPSAVKTEEIND